MENEFGFDYKCPMISALLWVKLLTDIFGFHDAEEYPYKISQNIRLAYPTLENELLKIYGIGS